MAAHDSREGDRRPRAPPSGLGALAHSTPSQHAQRRETAVILADALATLTPDQRQAVLLRTRNALSWEEVGKRMGRSADAVRQLWVRGLHALRPILERKL
ncbi:MAG: RNA polymerase sigma factor [Planctomycetota bacterium]